MSRDSIRARVKAATPGRWFHYHAPRLRERFAGSPVNEISVGPGGRVVVSWTGFDAADTSHKRKQADAAFIAHARQDVPALLAVADAAAAIAPFLTAYASALREVHVNPNVMGDVDALHAALDSLEAMA